MTRKKKVILVLLLLVIIAGGAGGYFYYRHRKAVASGAAGESSQQNDELDRNFTVKRDDLVIGLFQGGYINASKKHKVALQANYKTKILWVIDENSKVKKGDILAKLETDDLKEQIENYVIELDNLTKELAVAYEEEKILESTNAASLQNAEEQLLQADDALRKYRRFERASKRDELDLAITNAENALADAKDEYIALRDSDTASSSDENAEEERKKQLAAAKEKISQAENSLSLAEDNRKVFRRYDHPSKMTRLVNAYDQAKLNLRKTKISTESQVVQKRKHIANLQRRIKRVRDQLARHREYLKMMVIVAPADGVVIYADPDRRWGNIDVKPGLEIWKGQVLFTIPEMSNLVVDFDLPEQYRSKVSLGDRAYIFPDSLPGEKFEGEIMHIDTLPVNLVNWDSSSPKVYKTKIKLDKQSPRLVNGMSAQINVITKVIKDTLFVPVEAVFDDKDRFFVYRNTPSGPVETDVTIGEANDNFVQITSGLEEGDSVCLYRPYQKSGEGK